MYNLTQLIRKGLQTLKSYLRFNHVKEEGLMKIIKKINKFIYINEYIIN